MAARRPTPNDLVLGGFDFATNARLVVPGGAFTVGDVATLLIHAGVEVAVVRAFVLTFGLTTCFESDADP